MYYSKYIKYKTKYLELKNILGGSSDDIIIGTTHIKKDKITFKNGYVNINIKRILNGHEIVIDYAYDKYIQKITITKTKKGRDTEYSYEMSPPIINGDNIIDNNSPDIDEKLIEMIMTSSNIDKIKELLEKISKFQYKVQSDKITLSDITSKPSKPTPVSKPPTLSKSTPLPKPTQLPKSTPLSRLTENHDFYQLINDPKYESRKVTPEELENIKKGHLINPSEYTKYSNITIKSNKGKSYKADIYYKNNINKEIITNLNDQIIKQYITLLNKSRDELMNIQIKEIVIEEITIENNDIEEVQLTIRIIHINNKYNIINMKFANINNNYIYLSTTARREL